MQAFAGNLFVIDESSRLLMGSSDNKDCRSHVSMLVVGMQASTTTPVIMAGDARLAAAQSRPDLRT